MEDLGFATQIPSPSQESTPEELAPRPYGVSDLELARRYGYRGSSSPEEQNDAPGLAPSPEETAALYGSGAREVVSFLDSDGKDLGSQTVFGGCLGRATMGVFGTKEKFVEYSMASLTIEASIKATSRTIMRSDSRYIALGNDWFVCMNGLGVAEFKDPFEAMTFDWYRNAMPDQYEISVAVADVSCKREVEYVRRADEILWSIEMTQIERYPEILQTFFDSLPSFD